MNLQENLKAYCDGELSIGERAAINKLLDSSEADRKTIEDLQRLSKSIQEYVTQPEPVGLEATLAELQRAKPKARARLVVGQQLRWIGATAAAVLCIGLFGINRSQVVSAARSTQNNDATPAVKARAKAQSDGTVLQDHTLGGSPSGGAFGAAGRRSGALAEPAAKSNDVSGFKDDELNGVATTTRTRTKPKVIGQLPLPSAPASVPKPAAGPTRQPLIQKTATLTLKVKNAAAAQQSLETLTAGLGGWIEQSNRSEAEGEAATATLTLRVPVTQFDTALKEIRALGEVISDASSGNDVTADVVDMDARLKVLRAEEGDYMVLLGRARRTGEIMEIRDKLTEIRTDIESITSERNAAKDTAAFSTIDVTLEQRPIIGQVPKPAGQDTWLADTWATAINGLASAAKIVAQLFIFVLVWTPIWLPTALFGAWIYRKVKW